MNKINRKTVTIYLIGTFLLTYLCWGSIIITQQFGYMKYGTLFMMILFVIGGFSPTIFSYISLKKTGVITFKLYVKEAFSVKQKPIFYLFIPMFLLLYYGIPYLFGEITPIQPWYIFIVQIIPMIIGGGLEELGWRYILQSYLEKKFTFGIASSITAVIWLLWHIPMFFILGTNQQQNMMIPIFAISIFGLSFALAALYRVSKSIWLCILYHAMMNAFLEAFLYENSWQSALCASIAMMITSIAIVLWNNKKQSIHKINIHRISNRI